MSGSKARSVAGAGRIESAGNVVSLTQRILPGHRVFLARWLAAGRPMGLCDASAIDGRTNGARASDYALVWVRENADPAYMITPDRMQWVVTDYVRKRTLGRHGRFEDALNSIRPVLPPDKAACA